jgi:hypothetical protein
VLRDRADSEADKRRFVQRVAAAEIVWALKDGNGFAWCESNEEEDREVLVFWSDRAYAARAGKTEFPKHEVVTIPLFDFLFRWLPGMSDDQVLAGPNWTGDLTGLEVDPDALLEELMDRLSDEKRAEYLDRFKKGIEAQRNRERA